MAKQSLLEYITVTAVQSHSLATGDLLYITSVTTMRTFDLDIECRVNGAPQARGGAGDK